MSPEHESFPAMLLVVAAVETPIGSALVAYDGQERLCALDWDESRLVRLVRRQHGPRASLASGGAPRAFQHALEAYFAGHHQGLATLPRGAAGTPFQRRVWAALSGIPAGFTETYGALAARIGSPRAVRAVGLATGQNPIAIAVPCHRVIGSKGALTGYAWGLARKRWLLGHEGVSLGRSTPVYQAQAAATKVPVTGPPLGKVAEKVPVTSLTPTVAKVTVTAVASSLKEGEPPL